MTASNRPPNPKRKSAAAGLSAGTGLSGIVLLMPDGLMKSLMLLSCPAVTVVISGFWEIFTQEIETIFAGWRIKRRRIKADRMHKRLIAEGADPELIAKAKKIFDTLSALEIEIANRHMDAIVAS